MELYYSSFRILLLPKMSKQDSHIMSTIYNNKTTAASTDGKLTCVYAAE